MRKMKLITCYVREGLGKPAIAALFHNYNIASADSHVARGIGKSSQFKKRGREHQLEKDIVTVMVSADLAEEVFEFLFHKVKIDQPHGGVMFMNDLSHSSDYSTPDDQLPFTPVI